MDNCEICKGASGGVLGNENIIEGVVMCDYCSADFKGPYLIGGTTKPSPGKYNVVVEGVHTFLPIFATYDGENWSKIPFYGTGKKAYWYPNKE